MAPQVFPQVFNAQVEELTTTLNKYEVTSASRLLGMSTYVVNDANAENEDDSALSWLNLHRGKKVFSFFKAYEQAGLADRVKGLIYNGQWLYAPSDIDLPAVSYTSDREGEQHKTYTFSLQKTNEGAAVDDPDAAAALVQKIASQFQGVVMKQERTR